MKANISFLSSLSPLQGRGRGLHPQRGGRTASREIRAAAWGPRKREGGGWPLPFGREGGVGRLRAASGGSPSRTPLRAVIYYRHQWPILFLSQPGQKGAGLGLPSVNSLQKAEMQVGRARDGEKSAQARTATQLPARPLRPDPRGPEEQREQSRGGKGPEGACISLNRSLPVLPLRPGSLPPAGSQGQPHAPSRGLEGGPSPRAKCRLLPTFPTSPVLRRQPPASIPNTSPPQGSEISKARPLFLTSFNPYRSE